MLTCLLKTFIYGPKCDGYFKVYKDMIPPLKVRENKNGGF